MQPCEPACAYSYACLQALTKGGQVLKDFLAAHPDMRATIPVLLASLRKMQ